MLSSTKPIAPTTAYLLMTLTALFWGGNFIIGGAATGVIPPLTLAWARWTGAALLILPFVWRHLRADWPEIRRHAGFIALLGCLGAGLFNTLQYVALTSMTAVTGSVINSAGPVIIAVACWLIVGDRLRLTQVLGIGISLGGVLAVVARGDVTHLPALGQSVGEIIMLIGLVAWGVYTALLRFRPRIHWLSFAACTYVVASLINTPLMLWEVASGAAPPLTISVILSVSYVAIFPSLISYHLFNLAVESIGGARASAFFHITPIMTALLAFAFLGETLQLYHVIGFALIIGGVWLTATRAA
jgi:drug/metabolite transporter (DMT)-like permease